MLCKCMVQIIDISTDTNNESLFAGLSLYSNDLTQNLVKPGDKTIP